MTHFSAQLRSRRGFTIFTAFRLSRTRISSRAMPFPIFSAYTCHCHCAISSAPSHSRCFLRTAFLSPLAIPFHSFYTIHFRRSLHYDFTAFILSLSAIPVFSYASANVCWAHFRSSFLFRATLHHHHRGRHSSRYLFFFKTGTSFDRYRWAIPHHFHRPAHGPLTHDPPCLCVRVSANPVPFYNSFSSSARRYAL